MHNLQFHVGEPIANVKVIVLRESIVSITKRTDFEKIYKALPESDEQLRLLTKNDSTGTIAGLKNSSEAITEDAEESTYDVEVSSGEKYSYEDATERSKKHIEEMWAALSDDT